jgi:hypothetical protein
VMSSHAVPIISFPLDATKSTSSLTATIRLSKSEHYEPVAVANCSNIVLYMSAVCVPSRKTASSMLTRIVYRKRSKTLFTSRLFDFLRLTTPRHCSKQPSSTIPTTSASSLPRLPSIHQACKECNLDAYLQHLDEIAGLDFLEVRRSLASCLAWHTENTSLSQDIRSTNASATTSC